MTLTDSKTKTTTKTKTYGQSIHEEITAQDFKFKDLIFTPQAGTAIVFDQRLLHKSDNISKDSVKYVLRTDLICRSVCKDETKLNYSEFKLQSLTKSLFRQVQLLELKNESSRSSCSDIYERCLNLRCFASQKQLYPVHLETLLTDININSSVPLLESTLVFDSRNGHKTLFSISLGQTNSSLSLVKVAVIYSFLNMTREISNSSDSGLLFKKWLNIMNIEITNETINDKNTKEFRLKSNTTFPSKTDHEMCDLEDMDSEMHDYLTQKLKSIIDTRYLNFKLDKKSNTKVNNNNNNNNELSLCMNISMVEYEYRCTTHPGCSTSHTETVPVDEVSRSILRSPTMRVSDVIIDAHDENKTSGVIHIVAPSKSENHASCNFDDPELEEVDNWDNMIFVTFSFHFNTTSSSIVITSIPRVVV